MRIKIWVKDLETGAVLEELGTCLTDNPTRAVEMYNQDVAWAERGYNATIAWEDVTNLAAAALGSIRTAKKAASSAANAKLGRRPTNYVVMHTGYPVAGRPIRSDEWSELSRHATESAAWKKVLKARKDLEPGSWNDHYRVIAPDGSECDLQTWQAARIADEARRLRLHQ
jgi:hypothetical protein